MTEHNKKDYSILEKMRATFGLIGGTVWDDLKIIIHNGSLFIGIAITLIGLFTFKSARYCDGNTADFYSCTRPSTYYYYTEWSIALLILGVFLIVAWIVRYKEGS